MLYLQIQVNGMEISEQGHGGKLAEQIREYLR
jgi:hypothetical protein